MRQTCLMVATSRDITYTFTTVYRITPVCRMACTVRGRFYIFAKRALPRPEATRLIARGRNADSGGIAAQLPAS
jgi:predicted signal transduction protein with EAL and GGDEF domain